MAQQRNRLDTQYIAVPVTADVTLGGQSVFMAFTDGTRPTDEQAHPATWYDYVAPAKPPLGKHSRVLTGPGTAAGMLPTGLVTVWVRVIDNPESVWTASPIQLYVE